MAAKKATQMPASKASASKASTTQAFTVPGLSSDDGSAAIDILQSRLTALADLVLTLKHVHWNVVGPNFIGVHEMLDTQYEGVSKMVDDVAERIATLGGVPHALSGYVVSHRSWDDYAIGRATVMEHLGALDVVYRGVVEDQRACIDKLEPIDPVSQDMLIGHAKDLEQYQWFVRAHLENSGGGLPTEAVRSERAAADRARSRAS
jgi:starvation-inducible DNA-binding protein